VNDETSLLQTKHAVQPGYTREDDGGGLEHEETNSFFSKCERNKCNTDVCGNVRGINVLKTFQGNSYTAHSGTRIDTSEGVSRKGIQDMSSPLRGKSPHRGSTYTTDMTKPLYKYIAGSVETVSPDKLNANFKNCGQKLKRGEKNPDGCCYEVYKNTAGKHHADDAETKNSYPHETRYLRQRRVNVGDIVAAVCESCFDVSRSKTGIATMLPYA